MDLTICRGTNKHGLMWTALVGPMWGPHNDVVGDGWNHGPLLNHVPLGLRGPFYSKRAFCVFFAPIGTFEPHGIYTASEVFLPFYAN